MPTATIVTETYNFSSGHSSGRLEESLFAAARASLLARGGPHQVLLIDAGNDVRTTRFVRRIREETGATIRHARVPSQTSYDTMKDLGAELSDTDIVAYLDGDCVPASPPELWLEAMIDGLSETGASAVAGTTVYLGSSALQLASTVIDFGFLVDNPSGGIGCYASNNVAFVRALRARDKIECGGLRCGCFLHAQKLLREGHLIHHLAGDEALVTHEPEPVLRERLRRGHDAVIVGRLDPATTEGRLLTGPLLRTCTIGVAAFARLQWFQDRTRITRLAPLQGVKRSKARVAMALIPVLRGIELVGQWRALIAGPSSKWTSPVSFEQARIAAINSMTS